MPATLGSEANTAELQSWPGEPIVSSLLTIGGLPNDQGRLRWPLGLRILAARETDELRERIDALFQEAVNQAAEGPVSSLLIQEIRQAVYKFRRLLLKDKAERLGMPLAVYKESERFLDQLEHAAEVLKPGLHGPRGEDRRMTTVPSTTYPALPLARKQQESVANVGIYDNYFQPPTITVPVGATIQWINHGHHRHTVTSDEKQWSSVQLSTNGIYTYTFTRPGAYFYHCAVHPQEMRATILVK